MLARLLFFCGLVMASNLAVAMTIYKSTDANGVVSYSDRPSKGAKVFVFQDRMVERLERHLAACDGAVHVVGHSLGGMLAVELANRTHVRNCGRIVCLGSPLLGSAAARGLAKVLSLPSRLAMPANR